MSKSLGNFYTFRICSRKVIAVAKFVMHLFASIIARPQFHLGRNGRIAAGPGRIDDWLARLRRSGGKRIRRSTSSFRRPHQTAPEFEDALMTILIFPARLGFSSRRSGRQTGRLIGQTESPRRRCWLDWWERINHVLSCRAEKKVHSGARSRRWPRHASKRGLQKSGEKVMNCATNSPRLAGKPAIQRTGKKLRDAPAPSFKSCFPQQNS